jgi:hypothetical protein
MSNLLLRPLGGVRVGNGLGQSNPLDQDQAQSIWWFPGLDLEDRCMPTQDGSASSGESPGELATRQPRILM